MESGSASAVIPVVMLRCLDLIRTRLTRRLLVKAIRGIQNTYPCGHCFGTCRLS